MPSAVSLSCGASIPTTIAVAQGIKEQKRQKAEAEAAAFKPVKITLFSQCKRTKGKDVDGRQVVLTGGKLFLATSKDPHDDGFPFSGFLFDYLDKQSKGIVSKIAYDPPMLNWIYVSRDTGEVRHGTGSESKEHLHGDWSIGPEGDLLIEGKEKFIAIKGENGKWELHHQEELGEEQKKKIREGKEFFAVRLMQNVLEDQE